MIYIHHHDAFRLVSLAILRDPCFSSLLGITSSHESFLENTSHEASWEMLFSWCKTVFLSVSHESCLIMSYEAHFSWALMRDAAFLMRSHERCSQCLNISRKTVFLSVSHESSLIMSCEAHFSWALMRDAAFLTRSHERCSPCLKTSHKTVFLRISHESSLIRSYEAFSLRNASGRTLRKFYAHRWRSPQI